MKKIVTVFCLLGIAMAGFASTSQADEASFFYEVEGWLIRAFTEGALPPYTVKIDVRDTSNVLVPASSIVGMSANPTTVSSSATSPNISLSFDTGTATAYVFYTTTGGLQLTAFQNIMSGGPNITVDPSSVAFGSVNVGSTSDRTVTVSNTGNETLVLGTISVTGTGFARNGGTCAGSSQSLGQGQSCTVIVRFAPNSATSFSGTLSIPSNDENVNVSLSGTGVSGGGGGSDLVITRMAFQNCCDNNKQFTVTTDIKNQGTGAAGAFTVKAYMSADETIGPIGGAPNDTLLFTWNVSGLAAGGTATYTTQAVFNGYPIHQYYYIIGKVDADDVVAESNEANNTRTVSFFLSR